MLSKDELIAIVLEQIQSDIQDQQTDPLYSLLLSVPTNQLVGFLPQATQRFLQG